jgi:hypothetical protein
MHLTERRKYPRFNVHVPIDIGLINLKSGKKAKTQFKGVTRDISMDGLGLEMSYPASDILSFTPKLMGENKRFDLDLNANLRTGDVKGVGEVRWSRIHILYGLTFLEMGVFLKEVSDVGKEKWTNFVMSQSKSIFQNVSFRQPYSVYMLIKFLYKSIRDLISSNLLIEYILPILILLSSFVIIYWLVEIRYYQLIISCGISIIMILLTKSRIFPRKSPKRK